MRGITIKPAKIPDTILLVIVSAFGELCILSKTLAKCLRCFGRHLVWSCTVEGDVVAMSTAPAVHCIALCYPLIRYILLVECD